MDHNKFAKEHHQRVVEKGYWDKPREKGTLLMLIVTEITKLFDKGRSNQTEKLADIALRTYDLCGAYETNLDILPNVEGCTMFDMLVELTNELEADRVGFNMKCLYLKRLLSMTFLYAKENNMDLESELTRKSNMLSKVLKRKY